VTPPPATGPFLPGATIGILGGGQLGRMMALAARRMGYRVIVLDRDAKCSAAQVADDVVVGTLDDTAAALRLAEASDVVTLDIEHVPAGVLERMELAKPVRPGADVLRTIQDRRTQKEFLDRLGVAQARWAPAGSADELAAALRTLGTPAILKVRRAGYDGKGQVRIEAGDDPAAALATIRHEPAVVEERVDFARELSVVLARGVTGEIAFYPLAENVHRRHILHTTRAPAPIGEAGRRAAHELGVAIANALGHVGVIAVELFELRDGRLLVNEIAPRTHNSGHYTYGACATSQFEQHVRAVCGLPLGDPRAMTGAVMVNLMGDLWAKGPPAWEHVLAHPEARLHLYGKDRPAPGRKMGHVVLLDDDTDRGLATAEALIARLTPEL
jgi:5-(carboxyamino)imidazole ribonucleotide synthase